MGGMSPQESRLLRDGGVFPPVTPDPPRPPGQEEIVVPDLVIRPDAQSEQTPSDASTANADGEPDEQPE